MMQSKMLLLASFASMVHASTFDKGIYIRQAGYCDETIPNTDPDSGNMPQCMGGKFEKRTISGKEVSVCYKNDFVCRIDNCPSTTAGDGVHDIVACSVLGDDTVSGMQINPGPRPASGGMRSTVITNPMRGWLDMKDSQFDNFPATVVGRDALVPTVRTEAGFKMILKCTDGYGGVDGYCDHFVILYSCPPCQFEDGGNLAATLLADGWVPHRCGAHFDLDINVDSELHPFVIYHKQTLQGNQDIVVGPEILAFVFYANTPATSYCPSHTTEADCRANIPAECTWRDDGCHPHMCPRPYKQQGPWQAKARCQVCTSDASEARFVPALLVW